MYKFKENQHLTSSTKLLFNEAKEDIKTGNWKNFYSDNYLFDHDIFGTATQLLIQSGINPLLSLYGVPEAYLMGNQNLLEINIPDNINVIGESAFAECEYLNKVILPKEVLEIRDNAFNACSSLNSITLPKSLRVIGQGNFQYCENLNTVIYEGIIDEFKQIEIGADCFSSCQELSQINCTDGIIMIGENGLDFDDTDSDDDDLYDDED